MNIITIPSVPRLSMNRLDACERPCHRAALFLRVGVVLAASALCVPSLKAQDRAFQVGGATLTLQEVTTRADVYYSAMRFNRASNVWNVEVTVSNKTAEALSGPMVLLIESATGTSGVIGPDGVSANGAYYELNSTIGGPALAGAERSASRTLALGKSGTEVPRLITKVYAGVRPTAAAVAFTRTLNVAGQPLGEVTVEEVSAAGAEVRLSNPTLGGVTLGRGDGPHIWKFERAGYLPAWRGRSLSPNNIETVPYPRLVPISQQSSSVNPLSGGTVSNDTVVVSFEPATVPQSTTGSITLLDGQSLPFPLPLGWSPLQSFTLGLGARPIAPGRAAVKLWGPLASGEKAAFVMLDEVTLTWKVLQVLEGAGGDHVGNLGVPGSGTYLVVVPDAGSGAPVIPQVSDPLPGMVASMPDPASLTASGVARPSSSPASLNPELVTAQAEITVTNSAGAMPSGTLLHGQVTEIYHLQDASQRVTPSYDSFIFAYQRPGDNRPDTLHAQFPIRPLLLFGPEELNEAVIRVDVFATERFSGALVDSTGGVVTDGDISVLLGAGVLTNRQLVQLKELAPTNFVGMIGTNLPIAAAFELAVDGVASGSNLVLRVGGVAPSQTFVLARLLVGGSGGDAQNSGRLGLEPVQRLRTDAQGKLLSTEPGTEPCLDGLKAAGQYVLCEVAPQQGLVTGIAKNIAGQPAAGLPVRVSGQPWLTFSREGGTFKLLAPVGRSTLTMQDPASGDSGTQTVDVPDPSAAVQASIGATVSGPRIISTTPEDKASTVSRVVAPVIEFSEPINPGSLSSYPIALLKTNGQVVTASVTLNLAGTRATVLPSAPLDPGMTFVMVVPTNITDRAGQRLEGRNSFEFTTAPLSVRDLAAQLIIYEPGATNIAPEILAQIPAYRPGEDRNAIVVRGTPGCADPECPVILANESSGQTATVLSKPDGSFVSLIEGAEQDYVSATFVNINNSRVYIPVSKQLFDNGFVGLYRQGGILEAQSDGGPVRVYIQPEAITTRAKVRVNSVTTAQLRTLLEGVEPEAGKYAADALNIDFEGEAPRLPVQVSFPVDLKALGYPTNEVPSQASAVLAIVRETQGVKTFEIADQMVFTPRTSAQSTPAKAQGPVFGGKVFGDDQVTAGVLNTVVGMIPGGSEAQLVLNYVVVPLLIGPRAVVIKGRVFGAQPDLLKALNATELPGGFIPGFDVLSEQIKIKVSKPLPGAFVTLHNLSTTSHGGPGRLQPGMVYATSGQDGSFLLTGPSLMDLYVLTVSHPLFDDKETEKLWTLSELSLAGVVFKNFFLGEPSVFTSPPRVHIANAPLEPAPKQPCVVKITASQGVTTPPEIAASIHAVNSLVPGVPAAMTDAVLSDVTETAVGNSSQWTGTITASKAVRVLLKVRVKTVSGKLGDPIVYPINFAGQAPPPVGNKIPPSDTNDVHGPVVIATTPEDHGFLRENARIEIYFNKPIDRYVLDHTSGILLSSALGAAISQPVLTLSPDQLSLSLNYPGLEPDSEYTLVLSGQSIRDLNGKPLDQRPTTTAEESFTTTFRTPPAPNFSLPGIKNARGSAISGNRLYVLDSGDDNALVAFDITYPGSPALLSRTHLFGTPRDLAVVREYSYKRSAQSGITTGDVVAVVGGDLDSVIDSTLSTVSVRGQFLCLVNMADPKAPETLANAIVSYRVGSAVVKVKWVPPFLVYQEFGADIQQLGFVDLQEMIFGFCSPRVQQDAFPVEGRRGVDLTEDGDYVDDGEIIPIPQLRPAEFYGKRMSYVLQNTTQKIYDFDSTDGASIVGITLSSGKTANMGEPVTLSPSYRTLVYRGFELDISKPLDAAFNFGSGALPRRVTLLDGVSVTISNQPVIMPLAIVALTPDRDGTQKVAVVDITLPKTPRLLSRIAIPEALAGGILGTVTQRPDGMLEVAGSKNMILLNAADLAAPDAPSGQFHPAIAGFLPGAGSGMRSIGSTGYGIHAPAEGGRAEIVQSAPTMEFVKFADRAGLVIPSALPQTDKELAALTASMVQVDALTPARLRAKLDLLSQVMPPDPNAHYHVLIKAPGGAGLTLQVGLESLNSAGRPLANRGDGFAPVRAMTEYAQQQIEQQPRPNCGASIRPLTAYRMSNDPKSVFYNRYLSIPFAVICERVNLGEVDPLRLAGTREVLSSAALMRAFIDPQENGSIVLGKFAARVDSSRKLIYPVAGVQALTLDQSYIMGDNPPPASGDVPMDDTHGTVSAHSGEFRTSDVDMTLPSPRMPIVIERAIGGQDTYEGSFGLGWDFNYNQRLTELDATVFPAGLQMPLIARASKADSELAGSQDVLFHNGLGRTIHFRWVNTSTPPEYAEDPLVQELRYPELASDYYLPEPGVFDLLVKFKDGRFQRLTPEGMRFDYNPEGRLEKITDTFPANTHQLQYDRNGWLVRIDDRSVIADRFVEFGYYRRSADPEFASGLDELTDKPFVEGKVCRLRDYAGADVRFYYTDDGLLVRREGVEVDGENGGFKGRPQIHYLYEGCTIKGVAATAQGIPIFSAATEKNSTGKPVAKAGTGTQGGVSLDIPKENSAATLEGQESTALCADGTRASAKFDKLGHPTSFTTEGGTGGTAKTETSFNSDGLMTFIRHPEGNSETRVYDSNNSVFRARGNLKSRTVNPGPRGGTGYTETFNYDLRYNVHSGAQTDANGFTITHTLNANGRALERTDYGSDAFEAYTYNDNGQVTSHVSIDGTTTGASYESATGFAATQSEGGVVHEYHYDGSYASKLGRPSSITTKLGAPSLMKYNRALQRIEGKRGDSIERRAYDEAGRVIRSEKELGDGSQRVDRFVFNPHGFMTETTTENVEVDGVPVPLTYTYVPDARSRVKAVIHPGGTRQEYEYDNKGNVTRMSMGELVQESEYDLNGNLKVSKEGGEIVATYGYNGLDQQVSATHLAGGSALTQTREFYPGGQVKSGTSEDSRFGILDQKSFGEIDVLGRPRQMTVHGTTFSSSFSYVYEPLKYTLNGPRFNLISQWDTSGTQISYSDPLTTITKTPDENGRVKEVVNAEDGATYTETFAYDSMDHLVAELDAIGPTATYLPRADGQMLAQTNGAGHGVTYERSVFGELLKSRRADGMTTVHRHNANRSTTFTGDPGAGFNFGYDASMRMDQRSLRNGSKFLFQDFDSRGQPQTITTPGGTKRHTYDLQKRPLTTVANYQSTAWTQEDTLDGLGRIRAQTWTQDGGPNNTATFDYDKAGPILKSTVKADGVELAVEYTYRDDGKRTSIKYPSGFVLTEDRDATGRLIGIADGSGDIARALSWKGNSRPYVTKLGSSIQVVCNYDARGRLTGERAERTSDGAVLTHLRYEYDGADNVRARQFVHRGGKADLFSYDPGERLQSAKIGAAANTGSGFGQPLYSRSYTYDPAGLDYLKSCGTTGATSSAPTFASAWASHNQFLMPGQVDGVNVSADPMGNVSQGTLLPRTTGARTQTTFQHNGLGFLVKVTRADGVVIENRFRPDGVRTGQKITQGGTTIQSIAFAYDATDRLLEEYDTTQATPKPVRRYCYATGDAPVAADILDGSGQMHRYYYLRDVAESVIAVADATGSVVERVWYDSFGQPEIEGKDSAAPVVYRVEAGANGSMRVYVSEPIVWTWRDPGPGGGLISITNSLPEGFTLAEADTQTEIRASTTLETNLVNGVWTTVFTVKPSSTTTNRVLLTIPAAGFSDEWGNRNEELAIDFFPTGAVGTVYYAGPAALTNTASPRLARSGIGSPVLFQSQYFDYETGLLYLRARFYDPFSGMFIEPDPAGYEDSVNHYAAMRNNPVSMRDPTGLISARLKSMVAARKELREQLRKHGLHDLEISAMLSVMRKRAAAGESISLGLRSPLKHLGEGYTTESMSKAQARIKQVGKGKAQKAMIVDEKTGLDSTVTIDLKGRQLDYVSDVDGAYLSINGQLASVPDMRKFLGEVNGEYIRLYNARLKGQIAKADPAAKLIPNPPFQHFFSAHLPEQVGMKWKKARNGVIETGEIDLNYSTKIGSLGNVYEISAVAGADNFGMKVTELSKQELGQRLHKFEGQLQGRHQGTDIANWNYPDNFYR